jgi:hypothetical protein
MEMANDSSRLERGKEIFEDRLLTQRRDLDRLFSKLLIIQWIAAVVVALVYSPTGWATKQQAMGGHLYLAIVVGGVLTLLPLAMTRRLAGAKATRHVMAASQMLFSALFIHLSGGRIETHFHIFGSLAWLAFYLDWQILVTATIVVAVEHMLRGIFIPESVYGIVHAGHWRFVEHALCSRTSFSSSAAGAGYATCARGATVRRSSRRSPRANRTSRRRWSWR